MAASSQPAELKRALGGVQFFALGFGKIVGVGWLVVLGSWLTQAGPLGAILAFAVGGLAISLIGLCYAEMAAMRPVAGGEVPYVYEVFGTKMAFAAGWAIALVTVAVTAFEAISVGWIVGTLVPGIEGRTLYTSLGEPVRIGSLILGVGGTILLTILNYRGVRLAAGFQDIATYGKLAICALFIAVGIAMGDLEHMRPLFQGTSARSAFGGFLAVFVTVPFWYSGFQIIPQMMEERRTGESVNRAASMIVWCLAIAVAFYCGVVLAASMAMPWKELATMRLPVASAFEIALASPWLAKAVLLSALLGLVTVWNATFLTTSRILFALGRGRILHPAFARLHPRHGVPVVPVLMTGILGAAATFLGRNAIEPIVNLGGTVYAFSFLLIALVVVRLRRTRPDEPRPYRIPGGPIVPVLAAVLAGLMMVVSLRQQYLRSPDGVPLEWMLLAGWTLAGIGVWRAGRGVRAGIDETQRRSLMLPLEGSGHQPIASATRLEVAPGPTGQRDRRMTAQPDQGWKVIVTGAGNGIGLVTARAFLAHGARVHICDVDPEAVARVLEAEPRFHGTVANVGNPVQVRQLFHEASNWLGHVSVLVNNVGIAGPRAWTEDMIDEDWEQTIAVNLHGAFFCIKQALPAMKEHREGVIINISTVSVRTLPLMRSVYNVSKAALEALTLNVAKEAGRFNIRCNAIRPGIISNSARGKRNRARIAKEAGTTVEAVEQEYLQFVSMRTMIDQQEIADVVLFLASDRAKHVTGQIISVDGNMEYEGTREH